MNTVEFGSIEASFHNARTVQRLTLQDVILGDFPEPKELANPNSLSKVYAQERKLREHPDRYAGAYIRNKLNAYIKTSEWSIADELPFANDQARMRLEELQAEGVKLDPSRTLGIFGLVVSDKLPVEQQGEIASGLLDLAADKGRLMSLQSIKIVLHDNDPVMSIARDHGYEFTGRVGEAAGASGLVQRLYRKPLDS